MDHNQDAYDVQEVISEVGPQAPVSSSVGEKESLIYKYMHCASCGSTLHLIHSTDFSRNLAQEIARCPECGIQSRKGFHRLQ